MNANGACPGPQPLGARTTRAAAGGHPGEAALESLHRTREFTVTEDQLKLLRHDCATTWDPGEGNGGGAGIDSKRPYGNSYVERDIAEILDAPDEDWEYEDGEKAYVTDEAEERFMRLHIETMFVLQIVLSAGEFRPGRYRRIGEWASTGNSTTAANSHTGSPVPRAATGHHHRAQHVWDAE